MENPFNRLFRKEQLQYTGKFPQKSIPKKHHRTARIAFAYYINALNLGHEHEIIHALLFKQGWKKKHINAMKKNVKEAQQ